MSISFDALRVGKKYYLINYGERIEFQVCEKMSAGNYIIKDLNTLESCELNDFIKYGKGKDYELYELEK